MDGVKILPGVISVLVSLTLVLSGAWAFENSSVEEKQLCDRLRSAETLIPEAEKMNQEALEFLRKGQLIAQTVTTEKPGAGGYQELLSQYEQALARYREHRKTYLSHCKQFHKLQSTPKVSTPYISTNRLDQIKPLKIQVEDKCELLVNLEQSLLANEKKVAEMFENLITSQNKEGPAEISALWSQVYDQARKNYNDAIEFSHQAMAKTAGDSSIYDEIRAAQRDGIGSYQQKVYQKFQKYQGLQHQLEGRSNMHMGFAQMILYRLRSMNPQAQEGTGPGFTADDLQNESRMVAQEYARVQNLYKELQKAQKGM